MTEYVNPETIARYEAGFKQFAKNGALPVLQIVPALEAAKEEYTQDDVFDALEIMGIKDEPISIDQAEASSVFSGVDTENCILYVPAGTAEAYRQAEGWKVFKNIVEMEDPDEIQNINTAEGSYQIYTLDGRQVEGLQKGVNIIKFKNGGTQKIYVK